MTTTTADPGPIIAPRSPLSRRVWNVVRLQFTNKWQTLGIPWLAISIIFLANLVIWWLVTTAAGPADVEGSYNGGVFYLCVYMLVIAIQAMSRTFAFALGFSVTRHDYYLGTSIAFVMLSIGYGAALTLLSYIEEWTHGWGVGLNMFTAVYFGAEGLWPRLFIYCVAFLLFFFSGSVCATVFVRWRASGLVTLGVIAALLAIGAIALATLTESWQRVGDWFVVSGAVGVTAWMLLPTAVFAVIGYFILHRATPKG